MRNLLAAALLFAAPASAAAPPLDALFGELAKAPSAEVAAPLEKQVLAVFLHQGGATADVLMDRASQALDDEDTKLATRLIDAVTRVAPDYAEGWHQRARLEAAAGNDRAALVDLQKTVALNPRQFEALCELGDMLDDYGDKPAALAMFRKAVALDPHYDDAAARTRELEKAVEGQKI